MIRLGNDRAIKKGSTGEATPTTQVNRLVKTPL